MVITIRLSGKSAAEAEHFLCQHAAESRCPKRRAMSQYANRHAERGDGIFALTAPINAETVPVLESIAGELAYYGGTSWSSEARFRLKPFRRVSMQILDALEAYDGIMRTPNGNGGIERAEKRAA